MSVDPRRGHYEREWVRAIGRRRLTAFERALSDPDLVSLRQELVKVDLRIAELHARARRGESKEGWRAVHAQALEIDAALADSEPDVDKAREHAARLLAAAQGSFADESLWDEVKALIELRRKLSDTERKYEELHKLLIPHTQMVRVFDELHGAIESTIEDRGLQLRLIHELRRRLDGEARRAEAPLSLPPAYAAGDAPPDPEDPDYEVAVEPEPDGP